MASPSSKSQGLDSRENPCPVCGSSDFTWGIPVANQNVPTTFLYFRYSLENGEDTEAPVHARRCNQCGNILIFILDS